MTEQHQESQVMIRNGKELVHDSLGALPGLSSRAMFWRPKFLSQSDWLDHLPFAFWLIDASRPKVLVELGADRGASYFAFCQAADKLNTDTRCYAIDHWSQRQQQAELQQLQQYSQSQYEEFSRIIDHDYFQAPALFVDGSIDVFHLNLTDPTLDLVLLFQLWESKLSANAVVLLHHSQQVAMPGLATLKNKLIEQRRHFEFLQGHGLLVVQWQRQPSELFGRLMDIRPGDKTYEILQNLFSRLGKACSEVMNATEARLQCQQAQQLLQDTRLELADTQQRISVLLTELQEHKSWLASRNEELGQLHHQLDQSEQQRVAEQETLSQRVRLLETLRTELKQELEHLFSHVEQLNADKQQQQTAEAELRQQLQQAQQQLTQVQEDARQQLATLRQQLELQLQQDKAQAASALAEVQQQLTRAQQELKQHQTELQQQRLNLQHAQTDKQELERQLQVLTQELATRAQQQATLVRQAEQDRHTLVQQLTQHKAQAEQAAQAAESARHELQDLKMQLQAQQQQNTGLEQAMQQRFEELATLTRLYEEAQQQCQVLQNRHLGQDLLEQQLLEQQEASQQIAQQMREQQLKQEAQRQMLAQRDAELDRCYAELAELGKLLNQQQGQAATGQTRLQAELNQLKRQLQQTHKTVSWKITAPLRAVAALTGSKQPQDKLLRKEEQLISQTGLFDENWYLQQYPDVASTGLPALRHYLKFGGFEGRLPNPDFDSAFYLAQYPDVVSAGLNPLVHFVRFGRQEHRLTCPQQSEEDGL